MLQQDHRHIFEIYSVYSEASPLLESLMEGDFKSVLLSHQVLDLLAGDGSCNEGEDIEAYLERHVLLYLTCGTIDDQINR